MNLRSRLVLSFGAIVLLLLLLVAGSGLILHATRNTLETIEVQLFFKEQKINRARMVVLTIQGEVLHNAMFPDSRAPDVQEGLDDQARRFYDLLRDLERFFPDNRQQLKAIHEAFQSYIIFAKRALKVTEDGLDTPGQDVLQFFRVREERLLRLMDQAFSACEEEINASLLALDRHLDHLFFLMLGLAGLGSLFALGLSLRLSRVLSRPIRELIANIRLMEQGREVSASDTQRYWRIEEFGELAEVFDRMARNVRQKQDSLMEAERRYREIFENAVEGIVQSTPEGQILQVNPAGLRMLGYASLEEARMSITNIRDQVYVVPEDRDHFLALMRGGEVVRDFETQMYRKDGSVIWVRIHARPVFDDKGVLRRIDSVMEDVTEAMSAKEELRTYHTHLEELVLKRTLDLDQRNQELRGAVEALERGNQWLQGLLDNSPSCIFLKDLDNTFILANARFQETFSHGRPLRGKDNTEVFQGGVLEFLDWLDALFVGGAAPVQVERAVDIQDELQVFQIMLFPFVDQSGAVKGYGCMLQGQFVLMGQSRPCLLY